MYAQPAVDLVRMLARRLDRAMPVVSAKQEFCGETRPISDFHDALVLAENSGLIVYSSDYLSIRLR